MAETFEAEFLMDCDGSRIKETRSLPIDVQTLYDDMVQAGCSLRLLTGMRYVADNGNRANLAIMRGADIVDDDFCRSWWPTVELLAAEMLKREPWLRL